MLRSRIRTLLFILVASTALGPLIRWARPVYRSEATILFPIPMAKPILGVRTELDGVIDARLAMLRSEEVVKVAASSVGADLPRIDRIRVSRLPFDATASVTNEAEDPERARQWLDALLSAFLEHLASDDGVRGPRGSLSLEARVDSIESELKEAERAIAKYDREHQTGWLQERYLRRTFELEGASRRERVAASEQAEQRELLGQLLPKHTGELREAVDELSVAYVRLLKEVRSGTLAFRGAHGRAEEEERELEMVVKRVSDGDEHVLQAARRLSLLAADRTLAAEDEQYFSAALDELWRVKVPRDELVASRDMVAGRHAHAMRQLDYLNWAVSLASEVRVLTPPRLGSRVPTLGRATLLGLLTGLSLDLILLCWSFMRMQERG